MWIENPTQLKLFSWYSASKIKVEMLLLQWLINHWSKSELKFQQFFYNNEVCLSSMVNIMVLSNQHADTMYAQCNAHNLRC